MKTYRYIFKVRGNTTFPIDMLRYDRCFPDTEKDSWEALRAGAGGPRTVTIRKDTTEPGWKPTIDRWLSFGWDVEVSSLKYHIISR